MPATVIVNNLTVVHKASGGSSIAAPDVCKTPTPGGPVPIPYANAALSRDTTKGSKRVRVDGHSIMHKSSQFSTSSGDEPGTLGGVVSGKSRGKAYPRSYSFDVKVEGQPVFRFTDMMLQNSGSPDNATGIHSQANAVAASDFSAREPLQLEFTVRNKGTESIVIHHPMKPRRSDVRLRLLVMRVRAANRRDPTPTNVNIPPTSLACPDRPRGAGGGDPGAYLELDPGQQVRFTTLCSSYLSPGEYHAVLLLDTGDTRGEAGAPRNHVVGVLALELPRIRIVYR